MNIDKDIERVKNIKYITLSGNIDGKSLRAEIPEEDKQAIENVLEEFERLEKLSFDVPLLTKDLENKRQENHELYDENIKLQMERDKLKEELETWKKIAEKLAEEGNFQIYEDKYCDSNIFSCNVKSPKKTCKQCVIDWAKREVERVGD